MRPLSTAVTVLTIVILVFQVVQVAAFQTFSPIGFSGQGRVDPGDIGAFLMFMMFTLFAGLVGIGQVVVSVIWMYRASENVTRRGITDRTWGPGWAVGAWFIPLANLVLGFLVIREIWRGSQPGATNEDWKTPVPGWMIAWWTFYVASFLVSYTASILVTISNIRQAFSDPGIAPAQPSLVLQAISVTCYVIAGVFFLRFVRDVRDMQDRGGIPDLPQVLT